MYEMEVSIPERNMRPGRRPVSPAASRAGSLAASPGAPQGRGRAAGTCRQQSLCHCEKLLSAEILRECVFITVLHSVIPGRAAALRVTESNLTDRTRTHKYTGCQYCR